MTRPRSRPPRTNVISLRDHPAQLALEWERKVLPELMQSARYYKALLATKPSIKMVLDVWFRQREDFELVVKQNGALLSGVMRCTVCRKVE